MTDALWLHRSVVVINGLHKGRRGVVIADDGEQLTVREAFRSSIFYALKRDVKTTD